MLFSTHETTHSHIHSSKAVLLRIILFLQFLFDPGGSNVAMKVVFHGPSASSGGRISQIPRTVKPAGATPHEKVSQGCGITVPTHMEVNK